MPDTPTPTPDVPADVPEAPPSASAKADAPTKPTPSPDGLRKALEAERKARREAERRARELEEQVAARELAEARRAVAAELGLTDEQAELLAGSTRDELAAHAERLRKAFAPAPPAGAVTDRPAADLRGGTDPTLDPMPDPRSLADRIFSRGL